MVSILDAFIADPMSLSVIFLRFQIGSHMLWSEALFVVDRCCDITMRRDATYIMIDDLCRAV